MPAEAGIQKNPRFPFPACARTSFTGMTTVENKSLVVS
jgi:hypothetical protein